MLSGLQRLRDAAGRGDGTASKQGFVAAVGALADWVAATGIQGQLQGL